MPNVGTYRGITIYYQEDRKRYRMWYTDNKGRKKPVYGNEKAIVKDNYDKIQEQLRKGSYLAKVPDTFNKLMDEMLEEQEEYSELKDNSLNRKRDSAKIVKEYMKCSHKPIKNISANELNEELKRLSNIKKFIQSKDEEVYRFSQSYLNKIYSLIREVFHYAVKEDKLSKELNPFEIEGKVKKPKSNKDTKIVKPFTREECIKFLEVLNKSEHKYTDILKVQLFGGLRIGETLGLTSANIDLQQDKIYIETTVTKNKFNKTVRGATTKTPSGTRSIPLTPMLRDILEPRVNKNRPQALIFSNNGKPINESNIIRVMRQLCVQAGIRVITIKKKKANGRISNLRTSNITVHGLRHLYASIGVLVKADPKALQVLLGHKDISVTMNIYADAQDELKERNAEMIEDYFTSLTLESASTDMETLFQNMQNLKLHTLEEKEIIHYKREILRLVSVPKLEEQVKNLTIKISNIEDTTEDSPERLKLIYTLLNNMTEFKNQTRNIKRNTNQCNDDYNYIYQYLQTTQYLVKAMGKATEYKPVKQPATIKTFAINY